MAQELPATIPGCGGGGGNPGTYTLTMTCGGQGSVTAFVGGETYTGPGSYQFPAGTVVTLTHSAAEGWSFTGWDGDITGNTVTMDGDKTVTARFMQDDPDKRRLTISFAGSGQVYAYLGSTLVHIFTERDSEPPFRR